VIGPEVPDMGRLELVTELYARAGGREVPVILVGPDQPGPDEKAALDRISEQIVVRRVPTVERLLEQSALLLHRVEANLPESKRRMLEDARQFDPMLSGKRVLIVDDDVRNIFALASILERAGIEVLHEDSGRAGIEMLLNTPGIDAVLMDIMMPGMDGYETMRAIREIDRFRALPIIAVTAKAMKGDREKCMEAGASDYIPKPVDLEQLFSMLRVWLYRPEVSSAVA
jgi:CheY-like chemotaxis protein